jgi:hypothetical protein
VSAPQCDHRGPSTVAMGGRRLGRRCTKASKYHAFNKSGEGAGNFCEEHGLQRSKPGVSLTLLPRLGRCECCNGDVPHAGAAVHKRPRRRCTRTASVQLRKAADVTIMGKPIPAGPWGSYCDLCAEAIEKYQGDIVERRKEAA